MRAQSVIQVEPFRISQLPRILEIESQSFFGLAYSEATFHELYRDCGELFFIARRGSRILGYMVTCRAGARAEIVSIAVDPEYRQKGAASALMLHTLAHLKSGAVYLTVRPQNAAAIAFYRAFGFNRVRLVKGYYEDSDGIRMRKVL